MAEKQTTSAFALLDKIDQLAGRGRNRDGLHKAAPGLQDLREHHGGDFIRLVRAGRQRMQSLGELVRSSRLEPPSASFAPSRISCLQFLLALTSVLNHLLQALHDELVLALVELAEMPMRFGQSQCRDEHRVVDFDERLCARDNSSSNSAASS